MKAGIIAVYIVTPELEGLFRLHLKQIKKNTSCSYNIYCLIKEMPAQLKNELENDPTFIICSCPKTDLKSHFEHSYYLEYLTKTAIDDNCNYIVTLHLDSFPVNNDWVEKLIKINSNGYNVICPDIMYTSCLFFNKEFYNKYHPTYLIPGNEVNSGEYKKFIKEQHPTLHSGSGYLFACYVNKLTSYFMNETVTNNNSDWVMDYENIYEDIIYHLGQIVQLSGNSKNTFALDTSFYLKYICPIVKQLKLILPISFINLLKKRFASVHAVIIGRPNFQFVKNRSENKLKNLLDNPELYLDNIRAIPSEQFIKM